MADEGASIQTGKARKSRAGLFVFFGIFIVACGLNWQSNKRNLTGLAQSIIDDDIGSGVATVDYISIPLVAAIPLAELIFPESRGYFSIAASGKRKLPDECAYSTYDYVVRTVADYHIAMTINARDFQSLKQCARRSN